uniref:BACK domain-containing protein n=1 Tax=Mesocestoides corti TaxID=53468 RepID=A0A5K3FRN9_MESCO
HVRLLDKPPEGIQVWFCCRHSSCCQPRFAVVFLFSFYPSRDLISNAWKEVRMRGPTHDYLIAYTDPSNEVTFATSEWEEFEKKILGRSSGAQLPTVDVNFRLTMPSRSECAVVMLSGEFTPTHPVV